MPNLSDYITNFPIPIGNDVAIRPWLLMKAVKGTLTSLIQKLNDEYTVENDIAIHHSALIESGVTFKPPVIIQANCKIGANSYFREGVFLGDSVKIGPSCEVKSSIICSHSAIAHLNYIGNSIIGNNVNFEGGSIAANHYNERDDKTIYVLYNGEVQNTGLSKFGALVGDNSKIGANAVLSPGTMLGQKSIVKRLQLVEQLK